MEKTANPKKFGRIRNQLILWFLLLGLVPLITVSAISYLTAKQGLEQSAYYELSSNTRPKVAIFSHKVTFDDVLAGIRQQRQRITDTP